MSTILLVKPILQALALAEKLSHKDSRSVRLDFAEQLVLTSHGDVIHAEHRMTYEGDPLPGFCLPRKDFAAVLKRCGETAAAIMDGTRLVVGKGKTRYRLDTAPAEAIAALAPSKLDGAVSLLMAGAAWRERFSPLLPAVGSDSFKPHFMGVYVDEERLVSSDGFRFSLLEGAGTTSPFILPKAALDFILGLAKVDPEDEVCVAGAGPFEISANGIRATCPGIEGKYPPYKMLVPTAPVWSFDAKADDFLQALRQVTLLTGGKNAPVLITPAPDGVSLIVDGAGGVAESFFPVTATAGVPAPVKLNWSFLEDALAGLAPEAIVQMAASTSFHPILLDGTVPSGARFRSLVMPLRL